MIEKAKKIKPKHVSYIFATTFAKVAALFAIAILVAEYDNGGYFFDTTSLTRDLTIVLLAATTGGLIMACGVIVYTRATSSFEYNGSWQDLRKKIKFI